MMKRVGNELQSAPQEVASHVESARDQENGMCGGGVFGSG